MDVTLPNGVTIRGVPDNATKDQIKAKAIAGGLAQESDFGASTAKPVDEAPKEDKSSSFYDVANEAMAAINRGAVNTVDVLGMPIREPVNALLSATGSDYRIPTLRQSLSETPASVEGNYMQDGLGKRIVRAGGEMALPSAATGGAIRQTAAALSPAMTAANANLALPNIARQFAQGATTADLGYGAASGVGSELGREVGGDRGAMIGAVAAPFAAAGVIGTVKGLKDAAKSAFNEWRNSTQEISGATAERNRIITEALQRSGMTAAETEAGLAKLGSQGTMADLSPAFSRQLKAAVNENPQLEGIVGKILADRSKGSYERLQSQVSSSLGKGETVDDAITSLESAANPKIAELYKTAKDTPFAPSERLRKIMDGDNPLAEAVTEAQKNLTTKRIMGESVGNMAVVDEAKKVLDGKIGEAVRGGNKSKVRDLTMLKNFMVNEADKAAPEWAAARSLFAGKQALKDSADLGKDFFKMSAEEVNGLSKGFGESEKHFYKLGAQQAILDKLDNINITSDAGKAILSKNGDIKKLATLFDSKEEFNGFVDTVKREATFKATANAVFGNSTTTKQAADLIKLREGASLAAEAVSSPMGAARVVGNIVAKLGAGKNSADFKEGLYQAGIILSEKGLDNKVLFNILKKQDAEQVKRALNDAVKVRAPIKKAGAISSGLEETQRKNREQAKQLQR